MDEDGLKRHAHAFEQLVVRLLESQYATAPSFVCVTVASHDGGYDGVLRLDVLATHGVTHYSLVEAKLRSSRELELAAIGKSVVVAYNASANALYIATNRRFAPQALKQLALFQWKTNLQIVLLDGGVLSAWVRKHRAALGAFDAELLDYVAEAEPRDGRVIEYIDPEGEIPIQAHVSTVAKLPRYELECGWNGDTLAPGELRPSADSRAAVDLQPMVGLRRQAAVQRIAGLLQAEHGAVLISGGAGTGKSLFVRHLRHELAKREIASTLINMTGVVTRRGYYLRVLAALTGVNVEAIASEEGPEGLTALLSTFSDDARPSERQAVAAVLASPQADPFREKSDVRIELITRYLERLARRSLHAHVLFYENLEHSTREVLELLRQTTRRLVDAGVSTVFEARRFGEAGIAGGTETLDEQRLSPEEWGVVQSMLESEADIEHYELPELTEGEAVELIENHWKGFGPDRAKVILRSVGHTPLFIEAALNWLHASGYVAGPATARVITDLEAFFEGIAPGRISQVFRKQLELWWRRHEDIFAAAALLDGRVPFEALEPLTPGRVVDDVVKDLIRTRLFQLDQSSDAIRVVHNLLGDELERLFQVGPHADESIGKPESLLTLRRVAQTLLPRLDAICGAERVQLKAPLFLGAAGLWKEALHSAEETMEREAARHEWANVSSLGLFALRASLRAGVEQDQNRTRLNLLLRLLSAEQRRGRLALDVNRGHVDELESRVRTTPLLQRTPHGRTMYVDGLLLAGNHHYAREEFDMALLAATEAESLAVAHATEIAEEDCARSFHLHGLALKGLDRREESFRVYADAVKRLHSVAFLRNEERSNLAAFDLLTKPARARKLYMQILDDRRDEPDARKIHVLVDVAMAEFLMKKYEAASDKADAARELADEHKSFLEAARARNILGCCAWVRDDIDGADLLFDAGCFAAERTLSKRYLWRVRVNRAGTAFERGAHDMALTSARAAESMITAPRMAAIHRFRHEPQLLRSRWYVALIALGAIYLQVDNDEYRRFLGRVPIPDLAVDCAKAVKRQYRKEVFRGTTHLHAGRIMITG